jgi:hypothetical protein
MDYKLISSKEIKQNIESIIDKFTTKYNINGKLNLEDMVFTANSELTNDHIIKLKKLIESEMLQIKLGDNPELMGKTKYITNMTFGLNIQKPNYILRMI